MCKIIKTSEQGISLIKHFESFHPKPYICPAGTKTTGYGFTRYPDGRRVELTDPPLTEPQADQMLRELLKKYETVVDALIRDDVSQHLWDATVSFTFNAGSKYTDKKGNQRLYNLYENINKRMPADQLVKYWENLAVTGGGKKLPGLVRRRKAEAHLATTGKLKFFL